MGREIRRVPANWEQPKNARGHFQALRRTSPEVKPLEDGSGYSIYAQGFARRCAEEKWPK